MNPLRSATTRSAALAAVLILANASTSQASDAVIVEVYQDCQVVDTNVVINQGVLSPAEDAEVKARVASVSGDPRLAASRIVQVLKDFGINDVAVSQQGLAGCEPETSGKFVEAVGSYCGARLAHAEIFVDRRSFMTRDDPEMTFDAFLKEATTRLRNQGIYDQPVVSIENAPDCGDGGGESSQG